MRKIIAFILLAVLLLLFESIYIFIPKKLQLSASVTISAPESALVKYLSPQTMGQWWPGSSQKNESNILSYSYDGVDFQFEPANYNTISTRSSYNDFTADGLLTFIPEGKNMFSVHWNGSSLTSINPISRIAAYKKAKHTDKTMQEILQQLKAFLEDKKKIYGIAIQTDKVRDTLILTTKKISSDPPSEEMIYGLIKDLKDFMVKNHARQTNYPIANITRLSSGYQVMAGIPIDKMLKGTDRIYVKRMLPGGNLLSTEVKGGRNTINQALIQLDNYMKDEQLSSPAIPFEALVTDRIAEPDTTKWITRIYYPVY